MNPLVKELLKQHAKTEHKIRNRNPALLVLHFTGDLLIALLFGGTLIMSGAGSVWMHTPPEPTSSMVNGALGWSLLLLFWASACRAQYVMGISGMPEESVFRHRIRLAILYGYQMLWMVLTAEAVILTFRTIVWWVSWR